MDNAKAIAKKIGFDQIGIMFVADDLDIKSTNDENNDNNRFSYDHDIIYRINISKFVSLNHQKRLFLSFSEDIRDLSKHRIDIFTIKDYKGYKDILKTIKKTNKKIGIEILLSSMRKSDSYNIARWIKCIIDVYKFCKLSDNQFILSNGGDNNSLEEIVSVREFESILKICNIDPNKYWIELDTWLQLKDKVYEKC